MQRFRYMNKLLPGASGNSSKIRRSPDFQGQIAAIQCQTAIEASSPTQTFAPCLLCGQASSPRAMLAGISETRIGEHTGHRDMNVLRLYYRNGMVFKGNPAKEDFGRIPGGLGQEFVM